MGSCPDSACLSEGAPGCKGADWPKLSEAEGRVQPLPSPGQSPGRARSPLWWGRAQVQPVLPRARQAAWRRRAEAERSRGAVSPYQAKACSGREPTRVGSSPCSACASEGAQCCKGVAGPKLRDAGEGIASPYWAKPGSGREPTRVGSSPDSACAAKGAPGCMGVAWPKPSYAGEGAAFSPTWQRPGLSWSLLGWRQAQIQPARLKARQPVKASAALRRGGSSASCRARPCSHMCGVQPSAGLCARRRARWLRRRWARIKQRREGPGGYSHSPQGDASVGRVPT